MATLKALADETTNIKNDTINCHTVLKNNLINKKVPVSSSDKMLDLVNKIPDIKAFPSGWDVEKTGEVFDSNIKEGDAILYQKYGSWDTQIDLLVNQPNHKSGAANGYDFSPDGKYLACACQGPNNGLIVYKITGDTFTEVFTDTFTNTSFYCCRFSPDGKHLVLGHTSSPYVFIYRVDSGDNFVKLSLSLGGTSAVNDCAFSPDGTYMALACNSPYYLKYFKRNGDTYTPLIVPGAQSDAVQGVSFSPDGKYLACALYSGNYIYIWKRIEANLELVFYGSSGYVGNSYDCKFSPDGKHLALVGGSTPRIAIFKNNGDDTFTKLPNPDIIPGGSAYKCAYSHDGKYLAVTSKTNNPRITIYKRDGDTYTKIANPSTLPIYDCYGVAFSSEGSFLVTGCAASPYQYVYRTATKDIVCPYVSNTLPLAKLSTRNIGIALESKNIGQQVKVNIFPKFNIL